jgi:molybdenum cofactor cytidylyltransferase
MVYGIVLAGGFSSRATCNKMVLKIEDDYLINQTIKQMIDYVDQVIVVSGHYHKDIVYAVKDFEKVEVIRNDDYPKGMFSSVKKGVGMVDDDFFIVPGDCPLICKDVYQQLLEAKGEIRVPKYNGFKGHPIFIEKHLIEALLEFDDDSNLKVFRDGCDVHYYDTDCPGILKDIDTLDDLKDMRKE